MAEEKASMHKVYEVLRLQYDRGRGQRQNVRSVGFSSSTVHEYLCRFQAAGLVWPLPEGRGEAELDPDVGQYHAPPGRWRLCHAMPHTLGAQFNQCLHPGACLMPAPFFVLKEGAFEPQPSCFPREPIASNGRLNEQFMARLLTTIQNNSAGIASGNARPP